MISILLSVSISGLMNGNQWRAERRQRVSNPGIQIRNGHPIKQLVLKDSCRGNQIEEWTPGIYPHKGVGPGLHRDICQCIWSKSIKAQSITGFTTKHPNSQPSIACVVWILSVCGIRALCWGPHSVTYKRWGGCFRGHLFALNTIIYQQTCNIHKKHK